MRFKFLVMTATLLAGCTRGLVDPTPSATFNGWTHIKAVGAKAPAAQASDMASTTASVTIEWAEPTISNGTIGSFSVYRRTDSGTYNYDQPLRSGLSSGTRSFTDTSVTAGQTYYYMVATIVADLKFFPSTADREVKVIVPPNNMVLLHRWAANQEICLLAGKSPDRSNHYRCSVATGSNAPPGTGGSGYIDLGASLLVDTFEQGCNYSYSTLGNKCGSADGCIGTANTPNGVVAGDLNDVYYSRRSGRCYINTDGANAWTVANSATQAQRRLMGSSSPGLPPYAEVNSSNAQDVCSGYTVAGFAGNMRLPKRREQLLVAAWSASLSNTQISNIETGEDLSTLNYCNATSAAGLTFDNLAVPAAKDTLPGCLNGDCAGTAASIRSVRTGSQATSQCVSRYGAQDMAGNVWEISSDLATCDGTTCTGVSGALNTVDSTNDDMSGVLFDDIQGPTTSKNISDTGLIQLPLGILINSTSFTGDGVVSWTASKSHGDKFSVNVAAATRQTSSGGSWAQGNDSGRYTVTFAGVSTGTATSAGFRCVIAAE